MSTQFRSRIKSVVDYGSDLKAVGTCCFSDGTSQSLSFYECFVKNGTYIPGQNVTCPDQGEIGTCYACAYLTPSQRSSVISTNGGILTNNPTWGTKSVTGCECTRIGGQLGSTSDPIYPNRDVRIPKSCCYLAYDNNNFPVGITCENVCSEKECSLKGISYDSSSTIVYGACCNTQNTSCVYGPASECTGSTSKFYPNKLCSNDICSSDPEPNSTPIYNGNKLCSETDCNVSNINFENYAKMVMGKNAVFNFELGPCYELIQTESGYSYTCDIKMLHNCQGYWVPPDLSEDILLCDNPYKPQTPQKVEGRFIEPEYMYESVFDSLGLTAGDEYKGGYYIGKYQVDGTIYGSLNLSYPVEQYYDDDQPRDQYRKWVIIADYVDYNYSLIDKEEMQFAASNTSTNDGFYNCYGNRLNFNGINTRSINTIVRTIKNGFPDFYIPSINELYFLAYSIKNNENLRNKLNMSNNLTSSSIFFEMLTSFTTKQYNFNGTIFTYGQNMNYGENRFGRTFLVPGNQKSYVRLFRKIILL